MATGQLGRSGPGASGRVGGLEHGCVSPPPAHSPGACIESRERIVPGAMISSSPGLGIIWARRGVGRGNDSVAGAPSSAAAAWPASAPLPHYRHQLEVRPSTGACPGRGEGGPSTALLMNCSSSSASRQVAEAPRQRSCGALGAPVPRKRFQRQRQSSNGDGLGRRCWTEGSSLQGAQARNFQVCPSGPGPTPPGRCLAVGSAAGRWSLVRSATPNVGRVGLLPSTRNPALFFGGGPPPPPPPFLAGAGRPWVPLCC